MPKQIKDPVHGYIEVPSALVPLLDTPAVQRLHHIRQLGFAYLVYPGANHTRFEHSLGAMHLASLLCRHLGLPESETLTVCAAGLLHDIGHGPYSHASERLMQNYGEYAHDNIIPFLKCGRIAEILDENDICPADVAEIVAGTHPLAPIIHGDLDVDRMDYLLRDAHYTGVPYGMLDAQRLIHSLTFMQGELVVNDSGLAAAESLLIARTLMGPSVYYHHVSRIAEEMFLAAANAHFTEVPADINRFMQLDDAAAAVLLLNSPSETSREMMSRIWTRRLFKRAVSADRTLVDAERITRLRPEEEKRIAEKIAETAGVAPESVILDIPPLRKEMRMQVQVRNRHDLVPFEEIVPMISMMNATRQGQWRLGVYTPAEHREVVGTAAREILGLRRATKQHKLTGIIE